MGKSRGINGTVFNYPLRGNVALPRKGVRSTSTATPLHGCMAPAFLLRAPPGTIPTAGFTNEETRDPCRDDVWRSPRQNVTRKENP